MLCSREIFTDQRYHACIRSEKNPSIRSDACMTADYARGQPASTWPPAGAPCLQNLHYCRLKCLHAGYHIYIYFLNICAQDPKVYVPKNPHPNISPAPVHHTPIVRFSRFTGFLYSQVLLVQKSSCRHSYSAPWIYWLSRASGKVPCPGLYLVVICDLINMTLISQN